MKNYAGNEELQQRIHSGAAYFCEALLPVRALFDKTSMPLDNKELRKQLNERLQALDDALWIKESLLDAMRTEKFTVTDYLKRKAKVMLSLEGNCFFGSSTKARRRKRTERTHSQQFRKGESRSSDGYSASGALSCSVGMENGKDAQK